MPKWFNPRYDAVRVHTLAAMYEDIETIGMNSEGAVVVHMPLHVFEDMKAAAKQAEFVHDSWRKK